MNKRIFGLLLIILAFAMSSCSEYEKGFRYVAIETELGTMEFKLYNTTPQHRDNMVKLAKDGFYDGLLFHRVMKDFMAQGGDPESKNAAPGQPLGQGGPGYTVPAEIGAAWHFKGALAGARTPDNVNPEKRSSGSQFYVVQGKIQTDAELNQIENLRGFKYTPQQRELYKKIGGYPPLDGEYTVYGEVVKGMDVIDKICAVKVGAGNRPVEDIPMKVRLIR